MMQKNVEIVKNMREVKRGKRKSRWKSALFYSRVLNSGQAGLASLTFSLAKNHCQDRPSLSTSGSFHVDLDSTNLQANTSRLRRGGSSRAETGMALAGVNLTAVDVETWNIWLFPTACILSKQLFLFLKAISDTDRISRALSRIVWYWRGLETRQTIELSRNDHRVGSFDHWRENSKHKYLRELNQSTGFTHPSCHHSVAFVIESRDTEKARHAPIQSLEAPFKPKFLD